MLLDPLEEQFDLPATAVEIGDYGCRKREVVGEKDQSFSALRIPVADTAELSGIAFGRIEPDQCDGLVALHPGSFVDRMRDQPAETEILASSGDEEGAMQGPAIEPLEIEIAAIHDVESAGFGSEQVQNVDIVHLGRRDADKRGNLPAQVQQRVQFHGMLRGLVERPGK